MREAAPARLANGRAGAGGVGGACGWTFNRGNENSKGNTFITGSERSSKDSKMLGGRGGAVRDAPA